MQDQELIDSKKQLNEIYMLLQQNNILLHEIIKQNHLIAEITLENIKHYAPWTYAFWPKSEKAKEIKEELDNLYSTLIKKD